MVKSRKPEIVQAPPAELSEAELEALTDPRAPAPELVAQAPSEPELVAVAPVEPELVAETPAEPLPPVAETPVERKEMLSVVSVSLTGFWRAKRFFTKEPTRLDPASLSQAELNAILADPNLAVTKLLA